MLSVGVIVPSMMHLAALHGESSAKGISVQAWQFGRADTIHEDRLLGNMVAQSAMSFM